MGFLVLGLILLTSFAYAQEVTPCALEEYIPLPKARNYGEVAHGAFYSHKGKGEYIANRTCKWVFSNLLKTPAVTLFEITFSSFDLEPEYDYVNIYTSGGGEPEYHLTGSLASQYTIRFQNPQSDLITIEFLSDYLITGKGFIATWTAYSCAFNCFYGNCSSTKCECFEGYTGSNCGSLSCITQQACPENSYCQLNGQTGACVCKTGWSGVHCDESFCSGEDLIIAPGFVISPNAPGTYGYAPNSNCTWRVEIPKASSIAFSVDHLDTEENHDILSVFGGSPGGYHFEYVSLSGSKDKFNFYVPGNKSYATFVSDHRNSGGGFELLGQALICPDNCGYSTDPKKSRGVCAPTLDWLEVCQNVTLCEGVCNCHLGWTGAKCDIPECPTADGVECGGHGTCIAQRNGKTCQCDEKYTGAMCNQCNPTSPDYQQCLFEQHDTSLTCAPSKNSDNFSNFVTFIDSPYPNTYVQTHHFDGRKSFGCSFGVFPHSSSGQGSTMVLKINGVTKGYRVHVVEQTTGVPVSFERMTYTEFTNGMVTNTVFQNNGFVYKISSEGFADEPASITVEAFIFTLPEPCTSPQGQAFWNDTSKEGGCQCRKGFTGVGCSTTYCDTSYCYPPYGTCVEIDANVCQCAEGSSGVGCRTPYCSGAENTLGTDFGRALDHNPALVDSYNAYSNCKWLFVADNLIPSDFSVYFHKVYLNDGDFINLYWWDEKDLINPVGRMNISWSWDPVIPPMILRATRVEIKFLSDAFNEAEGFSISVVKQSLCPKSCSGHGYCAIPYGAKSDSEYRCVCEGLWDGVDCSTSISPIPLSSSTPRTTESAEGEWDYYKVAVSPPYLAVDFTDAVAGETEYGFHSLYLKQSSTEAPTHSNNDNAQYSISSYTRGIRVPVSEEGHWIIGIYAQQSGKYTIKYYTQQNVATSSPSSHHSSGGAAAAAVIILLLIFLLAVALGIFLWQYTKRNQASQAPASTPPSVGDRTTASTQSEMHEVSLTNQTESKGYAQFDD